MNIIDTRDLLKREAEIEEIDNLGQDEASELVELVKLRDEIGEETMREGETMIPVDDFTEYAKELAEDIGSITGEEQWPLSHIDWEAAADELKADYIEVSYADRQYLIRNA